MARSLPARFTTPEMRTGFFYAAIYLPAAVSSLLLPIWLDAHGISPEEIGLISAAPVLVMILLNLAVGRLADRASDWRNVIIAGALVTAMISLGFVFVDAFWGILIVNTLAVISMLAIEPVVDAAAVRMTRRRGSDFARLRIWGTLGYIISTGLAGLLFGWVGIAVFVPLFIAVCFLRGAAALPLPFFRASHTEQDSVSAPAESADIAATLRQILRPWFLLALCGSALVQASHVLLVTFGALLWMRAGVPADFLGLLWVVAPVGEILTMVFFGRLARRFSARYLLLAACLIGMARWLGMAVTADVWLLALLQMLHMASFGLTYLATITFIAKWTSEDIAAQAQSFYMVLRQVASVLALAAFGPLVAAYGLQSFHAAAGMAAVGALMVTASLLITAARRRSRP
jgi:PPP family 3-phenylpropionic acid transporter